MNNTSDEFIESMLVATIAGETTWSQGSAELQTLLEDVYGNSTMLFMFKDEESGADVVLAGYQYYEGEVEADEFIKDGLSVLLVDVAAGNIIHEITDEDVNDTKLFDKLVQAVEDQK